MLLTRDSSFSHKGWRACLAIFNFQSIPAASMPEPTLQEPLKSEDDLQQSRSTLSSTREESLYQASLMAGTRVLGPSDAPCLVKSSTAHGDLLLSIMFSSIGVIMLLLAILVVLCIYRIPSKSYLPSPCFLTDWSSALTLEPVITLTAEGSYPYRPSLSSIIYCPYVQGGDEHTSPTRATLGFWLLGLPHISGPPMLSRPIDEIINSHRPRFVYLSTSLSPISSLFCLHVLRSRRLFSCPEATNCIWRCKFCSQTLLLNVPRAKVLKTLHWKTIDKISSLKFLSIEHLVNLFVKPDCLSRCVPSDTFLPVISFIDYLQKHLETESISRPQPGVVSSLLLLQFSRTVVNCSRQTSNAQSRIPILSDFESPRRPSSSIMKRTSAPPSSFMERNRSKLLASLLWFAPSIHEAKSLYSTSQALLILIVTISKILELFAEVSLTHHDLACGMLLASFCLRVSMGLSLKLFAYLFYFMYVCTSLYSKTLYPLFSPFWVE